MSYFVGAKAVKDGYAEDGGFAINGGKGWSDCVYDNHQVEITGPVAIAMGNYYFTCATTGDKSKVEYTFGYKRCADGKVRIFLHHSSVPYAAAKAPASRSDAGCFSCFAGLFANKSTESASIHKESKTNVVHVRSSDLKTTKTEPTEMKKTEPSEMDMHETLRGA
eukprot:gnl/TRDRNA2_/TRDRNA2_177595_c1_seq13.p1 gnl/TRDRNA2_/TRDRNA2_177595_c1~~gnl/TRDRNA2_/TRDRNA2_177595_c1_seq13.p1  ORF type:complete len:189 (+),score=39.26 gnl/TRDRNA2_/TRDRNA2_177595_c1_seq13:74-568(+)